MNEEEVLAKVSDQILTSFRIASKDAFDLVMQVEAYGIGERSECNVNGCTVIAGEVGQEKIWTQVWGEKLGFILPIPDVSEKTDVQLGWLYATAYGLGGSYGEYVSSKIRIAHGLYFEYWAANPYAKGASRFYWLWAWKPEVVSLRAERFERMKKDYSKGYTLWAVAAVKFLLFGGCEPLDGRVRIEEGSYYPIVKGEIR